MVIVCDGCGVQRPSLGMPPDPRFNASAECRALMSDLTYYTLAHGDSSFIHQHLVDAYGAQHVRRSKSTVGAAFTLAGLYLALERGFTGRQVQQMHMRMSRTSRTWPAFEPPSDMGLMTVADVLATEAGPGRDEALMRWCRSVWTAWAPGQARVREMVDPFLA
ncbi:MAG: DUF5946 family protein [Candidatus Dormibacteraeota bacterium]|nr:DUF5946 family protein [Candidatus Dormibacteraeota bacterium]